MWHKIWNPSNRKVLIINSITSLALTLFLEYMERKSVAETLAFTRERTFVFLYNALIVFLFFSVVFLVRKKLFTYALIAVFWFCVGLANGIVLNSRKTPFTAVDLSLLKSTLPVLRSYLELWQIVALVLLLIAGVAALVCLFLFLPSARKSFDLRTNVVLELIFLAFFGVVTYWGVGRGALIAKFDNLIAGYQDYGVAYGFMVTAVDTGIDRPIGYSMEKVSRLKKKIRKKVEALAGEDEETHHPNLIFIQLESFFDMGSVEGLTLSEDPIPYFHAIQQEYVSGQLTVPVYGAGTINTEFEVITGMSLDYFGTGEYPYRSVLQNKVCDSMCYWLKDLGYTGSVIHNNNASFYDRDVVFSNLGFSNFLTLENMDATAKNEAGWAKDGMLTDYILDTLDSTAAKDYIYTISVQGHGDYPTTPQEDAKITVEGDGLSESYLNQLTYYVNQTAEMDDFLEDLLTRLADYPEEVVVVAYGDHLPGLDFEDAGLSVSAKYETPYFIWDNFGVSAAQKQTSDGGQEKVSSYQLSSKVLSMLGIHDGLLNAYHQTMAETKGYQKNLKLLQYDMLYGGNFVRKDEEALAATELSFSLEEVKICKVKEAEGHTLILGENFTDSSRVYVNGIPVSTKKNSGSVLSVSGTKIKEGDVLTVHQVSLTNENITLNQSEEFTVSSENMTQLYKEEEETP